MTVYAHLCDDTTLWHRLGSESGRAALHIDGANSAEVVLFADRAGLARLQAAVGGALAALDAQKTPTSPTDSADVPAA
ncbi:hypothetical protein [Pseudonocardia aurantiaca]|uniref:Uncharacterized protein n=1 Tax=Pseudonocardia aurantiaca TaxID=75290 RepID=A0ABW4FT69_9PSEU